MFKYLFGSRSPHRQQEVDVAAPLRPQPAGDASPGFPGAASASARAQAKARVHTVVTMTAEEDGFVDVSVRPLSFAEAAALPPGTTLVDEFTLGKSVSDAEMAQAWMAIKR